MKRKLTLTQKKTDHEVPDKETKYNCVVGGKEGKIGVENFDEKADTT